MKFSRKWSNLWSLGIGSLELLGIILTGAGCGGAAQEEPKSAMSTELQGAPKWVTSGCAAGLPDKKAVCGAGGVSGMTNPALARSAAEGRARTELARSLQVRLKAMLKDYQAATQGGAANKTASEQHIEDVSKQITDATLNGTRLEETWVNETTGTFWALVVLDTETFKDSLKNMQQLDEAIRAAIVERADKSFAELDAATEGSPPSAASH
jgi:hypothetical protein